MTVLRLAYDDLDTAREMARDAVACRGERHLASAVAASGGQAPGEHRPAAPLRPWTAAITPRVSPAAASFAARLFD